MPISTYDDQNIGGRQTASAIGSAFGTIPFLPGGINASLIALAAIAAPVAAVGIGTIALTGASLAGGTYLGFKSGAIPWLAKKVLFNTAKATQVVGGGIAYGATKTASWIYKHPYSTLGIAGTAGLGTGAMSSWMSPNRPHATPYRESMTNIMGGTSNYGISQIMSDMNVDGSIVFGMANRR